MSRFEKAMASPAAFVVSWFETEKYTARDSLSIPTLFSRLYLTYENLPKSEGMFKAKVFPEKLLRHAYEVYIEDTLAAELPRSMADMLCESSSTELVAAWLKSVAGKLDEKELAVICHWLWLIKRKALGMPVKYQIMPVLRGAQQAGKSTAIQKLISPVKKYVLSMTMDKLSDERNYHSFAYNLVVSLDEMAGAEKADMNSLKNQITTNINSFRKLYTHSTCSVPMSCSFIGSTNKYLNEMLRDSTGMRRFYEIKAVARLDWDVINTISYKDLWRGIDENLEDGYLTGAVLEEVNQVQKELVIEDEIEAFIKENQIRPVVGSKLVSAACLYQNWREWSMENGSRYICQKSTFVNQLKNRSFAFEKIKNKVHFHVNADCMIKKLEVVE